MACNDYFLKTFTNLKKHYNKLGKEIENTRMLMKGWDTGLCVCIFAACPRRSGKNCACAACPRLVLSFGNTLLRRKSAERDGEDCSH